MDNNTRESPAMAIDPRWAMWMQACEMLEDAEQKRREFFRFGDRGRLQPNWAPPVDVLETADNLYIVAALPGMTAEDVEVTIEGGTLSIRGRRSWPPDLRHARIHRLEIPHGLFVREVVLPAGRYQLGASRLIDGCLTVELRKSTRSP